jgi:hypothetical protein
MGKWARTQGTAGAPARGTAGPAGVARGEQGVGMDPLRQLLDSLKEGGQAGGNLLGLLHILIGRTVTKADGTPVSGGITWRELAALLKKLRWDKEAVRELGLDPADLPPRDRERFWYTAIARARVDADAAAAAGDALAEVLRDAGYEVGPAPRKS